MPVWWLASVALADDPAVSEEVEVWGDRLESAWEALDRQMGELGYRGRVRGDRTVYLPDEPWKPRVIVDHDGWLRFRSPQVVLAGVRLLGFSTAPSPYTPITGDTSPGLMIRFDFSLTPRPVLDAREDEIVSVTRQAMDEVGAALREDGFEQTLASLPDELQALWDAGRTPDGRVVTGRDERRALLLELWWSRTDTPEGEQVRLAIEAFFRTTVQTSSWPFTSDELRAAAERCPCGRAPAL